LTSAVAAFDVDGTLTTGDCVVPFLRRLAGTGGVVRAVLLRPFSVIAGLVRFDRDRVKEAVVGAVYEDRSVTLVDAVGKEFADEIERDRLRPDVLARLQWHQGQGHRTVLVSASMRAYLEPLAASLGVDAVLCTDVVAQNGRYTDRLDGGNCRGEEKCRRLAVWLAAEGLTDVPLWAYGDSKGDRFMLDMAAHPVWVTDATVLAVPTGFTG
jgi:phosphatidylglycerophosphatase C